MMRQFASPRISSALMLVRCNKNETRSISSFLANKSPGIIRNKFGLDLQLNQRSFHLSTSLAHNPRESRSSHNDHDHDHDHNHEKEMVDVHIHVPHYNKNFKFEAVVGDTLMDLVLKEGEELSEYFECACGGIAACSTCHVYLDKESYDKLGVPEDFELDMIDLAHTPKDTSRLGCQIQFSKNINGIKLTVPKGVNNLH